MKILFEIKENIETILQDCKNEKYWDLFPTNEGFNLMDKYFDSWTDVHESKNELKFTTAFSQHKYTVTAIGKNTWCLYEGPFRGLLQQALMPKLTPKYNLENTLIVSSTHGVITLGNYLKERGLTLKI